ncbi:WYL domain-containing transcriptional regulator [Proteiniborus sp. MB09-C3]|uniref:helix-turn-helix transcriptional regulator n=1 Tax=Proteiniborus sp. MB09-C3 TaxID=3050072 RepID=UPI002552228C|nr:WYL domain-containing transcriptional regulator [Proteiniborus sp. MB09-C3]WIV11672.1 WYL domain-containing transcriptional regulator [Proteiniborus sp. MB09-C3]
MSRISNALNMYFLLQVRDIMKINEIASELEVSSRMIKEYKKDLEMAGIYIGSKLGRYGGYYLENKRYLDGLSFTEDELSALKMAKETIKSGKYHYSSKFEIFTSKILNYEKHLDDNISYHNKLMKESDEIVEKEKRVWIDINLAINQRKKVKIKYKSLKKYGLEIKERIVNPYGIFDYKGATYFYGYCESARNVRFFKLSRILDYQVMKDKFDIKHRFKFEEIMEKSFGIFNDEIIDLELKIFYPMSEIVKEKQISKSQKITELDTKTILFEAKMNGYPEIKAWVMSMGSNVDVVKPNKLKEDIIEEATKIINLYKGKSLFFE